MNFAASLFCTFLLFEWTCSSDNIVANRSMSSFWNKIILLLAIIISYGIHICHNRLNV